MTSCRTATAPRDLVELPDAIEDHLTELSTRRKRGGRSLVGGRAPSASKTCRLAFLQLLFDSAGLPEQLPARPLHDLAPQARHLRRGRAPASNGQGVAFDEALTDLYVSPEIAKALLEADPDLA